MLDKLQELLSTIFGGLGAQCLWFMNKGIDCYNKFIDLSITLLKESPEKWNGGAGWNAISSVNNTFIIIGATLVIIFWCIGLCNDVIDIRMQARPETIIKHLTKLVLAEWFVTNSIKLLQSFFKIVDGIITKFTVSDVAGVTLTNDIKSYLNSVTWFFGDNSVGLFGGLKLILIAIAFLITAIMVGAQILYHAYIRQFKVLLIVPYGALATSTVAAHHSISQSSISYFKYALSALFETLTMVLALRIATSVMTSNVVGIVANVSGATEDYYFYWVLERCFIMFVTLGAVKEANVITSRSLGS